MKNDEILEAFLGKFGNRYEYDREIGTGSFAKVHLLNDKKTGEQQALKIMRSDLINRLHKVDTGGKEFTKIKQRFKGEAKIYNKFNHPNIAKLHKSGFFKYTKINDEIPYLIMQYIDGSSLRTKLVNKRPLDFETILQICKDILNALSDMHRMDIIHRDLKPDNIMIEKKTGKSVLIDFGLAKNVLSNLQITSDGTVMGTPKYMAPEQFSASREFENGTDLYAFGIILFEMLTGKTPFNGSFDEIIEGHIRHAVPDIRQKNPCLPPGIEKIVETALAKSLSNRYHHTSEILFDLRKFQPRQ